MERKRLHDLKHWLTHKDRKPLVLRGARQVGKTWLIRHFAKLSNRTLIELNIEKKPDVKSYFDSNDPHQILRNLNAAFGQKIQADTHILFLDEIQAAPELLTKLRWFQEEYATLPLIAAGSLLEFVLTQHTFSMPVGRINYMHLEPLSFEEFLRAQTNKQLNNYLMEYDWKTNIPEALHNQYMDAFKEYMTIGGLPAVVSNWCQTHSFETVHQIQYELLATYRNDFSKYSGRLATERLDEVIRAIPKQLGQKFVYSQVNANCQSASLKQALNLLSKARICHKVVSSAANGLPLGAQIKENYFKSLFLDIGLSANLLGLSLNQITSVADIHLIHKGAMAEQVVGQLLRTLTPAYVEPELYYWHRHQKGSNAEIDYIMQHKNNMVPIEVKAGSTGSLKSLHLFMGLKNLSLAVRINSDLPSKSTIHVTSSMGKIVQYTLASIPFYLIEQLYRLLTDLSLQDNNAQ